MDVECDIPGILQCMTGLKMDQLNGIDHLFLFLFFSVFIKQETCTFGQEVSQPLLQLNLYAAFTSQWDTSAITLTLKDVLKIRHTLPLLLSYFHSVSKLLLCQEYTMYMLQRESF